jgi:hypothetical protein
MQALASRYTGSENADEPANPSQNEKPMRQLVTKPNRQVATANPPPSELGYSGIEARPLELQVIPCSTLPQPSSGDPAKSVACVFSISDAGLVTHLP